jgi:glycosyltransferase involved in cell wall biosynthesis
MLPTSPKKRVLLLSSSLKRSGVVTWALQLHAAFMALPEVDVALLVLSIPPDPAMCPAGKVFSTGRARSAWYLRLARWLQLHKCFPRVYAAAEMKEINKRVVAILAQLGWHGHVDVVIGMLNEKQPVCLHGFPTIVSIHSILPESYRYVAQNNQKGERIVAVGKAAAERATQLGLPDVTVIHNPLDIERTKHAGNAFVPGISRPYLLFVGTLLRGKGTHELLQAFILLEEDIDLVYVGAESSESNALKMEVRHLQVTDRVHFTGFQTNPIPWMRHAELLVLPSKSEAMPYVAMEAVIVGCGIVVADFSAAEEFFMPEVIVAHRPPHDFVPRLVARISDGLAGKLPLGIKPGILESMAPETVARQYLALAVKQAGVGFKAYKAQN